LETYAQNWADEGQFVHSYGAYGENLAEGDGNGWTSAADAASSAVDLWYNEVTLYDYSNAVFSSATGHFTQLVWVASTQIGFGAYLTSSGEWLIVAEFDPPGNVEGEFAANVLQS
ncbi:MAG: pry1p, partial [Trebouxia sp. A1-2]